MASGARQPRQPYFSRIDLVGKDAIVIKDGMQITEFREGILPWAYQQPCRLVFDEYDAGRPDVMFVIQRVLESSGRLTLLDQARVLTAATRHSACLQPPTPLVLATRPACITAPSRSTRPRWTAGRSSCTLNYLSHEQECGDRSVQEQVVQ